MLYIYLLEDVITDTITEEESTISISEKEDKSTGLLNNIIKKQLLERAKVGHGSL
jgi:hypothetical protein